MNLRKDLHRRQNLLFLYNLITLQVVYTNNIVDRYCGLDHLLERKEMDFCRDYIHPEDYGKFIQQIKSLKDEPEEVEKKILVRLKNKDGDWINFEFTSRRYRWKDDVVISFGLQVDGEENELALSRLLQQQNLEYKHLLESLDEAYCTVEMIYDPNEIPVDYLFLETNPAFEKQMQLKNVEGSTIRELVPEHEEHWFQTYGEVAKTGESIRFQFKSDNLHAWFDVYAFKVGEESSRQVGIVFRNITDSKTAEDTLLKAKAELERKAIIRQKDLEESKEILQSVFDVTNLAIAVLRTEYNEDNSIKDFRFIIVNKVLQEMYLDKNVIGLTYLETSKYGEEIGLFDAFKDVILTGEPLDKEFYLSRDEFDNWFRVTARAKNDLLIINIEDISTRKKEAQNLKEAMRFNEQLVQTSPDAIMIINLSSLSVRYINKDIFREGGITRERVEGTHLADILPFVHPRDRELLMDMHRKILKSSNDDIHDIEIRLKLKGISWEWFSVRGKIFHRRDESWVEEYVLLVRNIHEQKITQKALLKAENLSIQGEVARTFAHELRNPLASIRMATDIMNKKLENTDKEQVEKYLHILSRSTKTLNNLVSNLLNSSNYTEAVLVEQDLANIVDQTLEKAADRIYLAGIKVMKNYRGPYPILADREKLIIALLNIIVNASEATKPEEGIIELEIQEHKTDFMLSITDNGHGLETEQLEKLFDAFYTNKENGVGVGLSSVKNILEDHDAQIKVSSKPGEGTTFRFYFHNAGMK